MWHNKASAAGCATDCAAIRNLSYWGKETEASLEQKEEGIGKSKRGLRKRKWSVDSGIEIKLIGLSSCKKWKKSQSERTWDTTKRNAWDFNSRRYACTTFKSNGWSERQVIGSIKGIGSCCADCTDDLKESPRLSLQARMHCVCELNHDWSQEAYRVLVRRAKRHRRDRR